MFIVFRSQCFLNGVYVTCNNSQCCLDFFIWVLVPIRTYKDGGDAIRKSARGRIFYVKSGIYNKGVVNVHDRISLFEIR